MTFVRILIVLGLSPFLVFVKQPTWTILKDFYKNKHDWISTYSEDKHYDLPKIEIRNKRNNFVIRCRYTLNGNSKINYGYEQNIIEYRLLIVFFGFKSDLLCIQKNIQEQKIEKYKRSTERQQINNLFEERK